MSDAQAQAQAQAKTLKEFLWTTTQNQLVDERQLRETHARYAKDIADHHAKLLELYKDFFQWTVEGLHHSDSVKARDFLMAWMTSKRPDLYASAVSDMLPELRRLEEQDVMNVQVRVTEDRAQYVFGKAPLYFHDPFDL